MFTTEIKVTLRVFWEYCLWHPSVLVEIVLMRVRQLTAFMVATGKLVCVVFFQDVDWRDPNHQYFSESWCRKKPGYSDIPLAPTPYPGCNRHHSRLLHFYLGASQTKPSFYHWCCFRGWFHIPSCVSWMFYKNLSFKQTNLGGKPEPTRWLPGWLFPPRNRCWESQLWGSQICWGSHFGNHGWAVNKTLATSCSL